jgi:hypothetical protein
MVVPAYRYSSQEALPERAPRIFPPDPTTLVYLVLRGERFGPYPRAFAEGLRRCHTIRADFSQAYIEEVEG